jgi:hypothetical protein
MGSLIVLSSTLSETFWKLTKNSMIALNKVGLSDDDQLILMMSYRERPNIFEIHKSDWCLPLKEHGGEHLTLKNKKRTFLKEISYRRWRLTRRWKLAFKNAKLTFSNLVNKGIIN